jgi:hypothetical protein
MEKYKGGKKKLSDYVGVAAALAGRYNLACLSVPTALKSKLVAGLCPVKIRLHLLVLPRSPPHSPV